MLDPIKTDAGALADLFFMKHRLNHYDVPPEFAELKTIGARVFDIEDVHDVAQIWVVEKRMQFFLFPAERDVKSGKVLDFPGWRYVESRAGSALFTKRMAFVYGLPPRPGKRSCVLPYEMTPRHPLLRSGNSKLQHPNPQEAPSFKNQCPTPLFLPVVLMRGAMKDLPTSEDLRKGQRTDVIAATHYSCPRHWRQGRSCQGGELNSRPRAYESPASTTELPWREPGERGLKGPGSETRCQV